MWVGLHSTRHAEDLKPVRRGQQERRPRKSAILAEQQWLSQGRGQLALRLIKGLFRCNMFVEGSESGIL